ncbi:MAG: pyridoxal phosphate-dependent aminotransferase [Peptococcaceae bacterium]|jgi:aspartate aminotransferase|nr:pyridoxal phosphate-dependent aminotransferase [Peptococcaceae bacterium]
MKCSNRISNMQESPIRKLVPYSLKAKANGKKVYPLNIGQPDIQTPEGYFDAVKNFKQDVLAYADSHGDFTLIDKISEYYKKNNMSFEPEDILVTNGGSEALLFAMIALCDPGDSVVVIEPFYTNYNGFAAEVSVNVEGIVTKAENGYRLPAKEEILASISDKARAIIITNPSNPTGVVYTKEELQMIAEIAVERDLFVIADEVYREFVYDGEFYSLAYFPELEQRLIMIDSVSKRYSACGARIGCIASKNKDVIANVLKLCQGRLSVPTLDMIGATALYADTPDSYLAEVNEEYKKRRDVTYAALSKMEGVVCGKPQGAFYIAVKLPVDDAEKFIIWMLEEFDYEGETVMMAPLASFYSKPGIGVDEARIAYILNADEMARAMVVLDKALQAYPGRK